jgi:hypothetical protein
MPIYNYVRPLFSNGAHVVHDAPQPFEEALLTYFRRGPMKRFMSDHVQLAWLPGTDLTVAWIMVEVQLQTGDSGLTYRRARYLHAIASEGRELTRSMAQKLFIEVYGEDLAHGIAVGQAVLQRLTHPQEADEARDLFAGRLRPLGSICEPPRSAERAVPAAVSQDEAAPRAFFREVVPRSPSAPEARQPTPLRPATEAPYQANGRASGRPLIDSAATPASDDPQDAIPGADASPTSGASLSTLLSARLNDRASQA